MKYPVVQSAHRGASGLYPENTLLSFRKAMEIGVDIIELDLRLTKDHQLVVIHDENLERTTNGTGKVWEITLKEIREFDAGRGEKVPILMEVLDLVRESNVRLCLEIKYDPDTKDASSAESQGMATMDVVIDLIKKENFQERIILDTFSENILRYAKGLLPRVPTLHNPWPQDGSLTPAQLVSQVVPVANIQACHYRICDQTIMTECRLNGLSVWAWDPDDPEEMRRLLDLGVQGIVTNRPDILNQVLEGYFR